MISSAFASLHIVTAKGGYAPKGAPSNGSGLSANGNSTATPNTSVGNVAIPIQVGMAQNVNVSDQFGTRPVNVIGTPLPVFHPGYMQTTISIEKATVDGYSFRNLGAFNPLWAAVGSTYRNENLISLAKKDIDSDLESSGEDGSNSAMYPFMFLLSVRDKISGSSKYSYMPKIDSLTNGSRQQPVFTAEALTNRDTHTPVIDKAQAIGSAFGLYVCVLSSARIGLSSQNLVIMDSIEALARPIHGTWFNDAIAKAFREENGTNGLGHIVNDILFGYSV